MKDGLTIGYGLNKTELLYLQLWILGLYEMQSTDPDEIAVASLQILNEVCNHSKVNQNLLGSETDPPSQYY